jgi:muconolactone delta-isomerase
MQFLTILSRNTRDFTDADFAPRLEPEAEQARTLYKEGVFRQVWSRGDVPGACVIIEAGSEAEVRAKIETLPLVAAGMLNVDAVIPLLPYRGFGPRG